MLRAIEGSGRREPPPPGAWAGLCLAISGGRGFRRSSCSHREQAGGIIHAEQRGTRRTKKGTSDVDVPFALFLSRESVD